MLSKKFIRISTAILVIGLSTGIGAILYHRAVDGWNDYQLPAGAPDALDNMTRDYFLSMTEKDESRYDALFQYFLQGFFTHVSPQFSTVHYPGFPSIRGFSVSGLEGFARTAPLFAAWLYSGRDRLVTNKATGMTIDIAAMLRNGIISGTNPKSLGYWGKIQNNDQRILESADIARVLWLTRKLIWDQLPFDQQNQIATWLQESNKVKIYQRNNWILAPVVVDSFLRSVGYRNTGQNGNYAEFKKNYLESGWYFDAPEGVDYYNTWSISYDLFWIHTIDPDLDSDFLEKSLNESALLTAHLITPAGIPIMGRSVCYRTAVSSPVIAASIMANSHIDAGMARRALDVTWRYFVRHDILTNGTLTEGYFNNDPRIVDNYTGAGSCHWGLRSLTLAYMAGPRDLFWEAPYAPLPVEHGDFLLNLPKLDWSISGNMSTGEVTITIGKNNLETTPVIPYSNISKLMDEIVHRPHRPANHTVKYKLHKYSSIRPFTDTP